MPTDHPPSDEPAFPIIGAHDNVHNLGLSMRDYFAAKAMAAQIACFTDRLCVDVILANAAESGRTPKERVAVSAYEYADAMLAARAKP